MTKLWLTSMSGTPEAENAVEMIEPIIDLIDGTVWVCHDTAPDAPIARYLESVKKDGKIIHLPWSRGRHHYSMNATLYCGPIEEGDLVIWTDLLERPMVDFVSKVKSNIDALMKEADVSVIFYYGKPFLFRYQETLEYRQSPHWALTGWSGQAMEWSGIEPNESKVRLNVRPAKRKDSFHWVKHYLSYYLYPAGSNSVALGLDHFPPGDRNAQFAEREQRRLSFRALMRERGYPLTVDGLTALLRANEGVLDEELKTYLRGEKILSDAYWYIIHGRADVKDSHNPADAIPIP